MTLLSHKGIHVALLLSLFLFSPALTKQYTVYFQSWSDKWGATGADTGLANLPKYCTTVILSFLKPDTSYQAGSMALAGSGLDFSSDGKVVKEAIEIAKSKGAKVLVAVGGATYTAWNALNDAAIGSFVTDFGLDGVDIDYEPASSGCTATGGTVTCTIDSEVQDIVNRIRAAVPAPLIVSMAGWSIGAYGEGDFANSQPQAPNTGMLVNLLKSEAAKGLDQINIMSYDAGPDYDPTEAFRAYRSLYQGALTLGLEVPPEAWGGHVLTMDEVNTLCDFVVDNDSGNDGMMLWSVQKAGDPSPTAISQAVCTKFGLEECDKPIA